jgi:beta-glucanase (GH16 family)
MTTCFKLGGSTRILFLTAGCLIAGILIGGIVSAQPRWQLSWSDDFTGTAIDTNHWTFEIGNGNNGWGNHELEYYTSRPQNAYIADGMLHIVARKEPYQGKEFTSAKLKTRDRFSQKYGRFEFCARLPQGKGYWPALWMMPEHPVYGPWAASGEIDVMENRGVNPEKVLGTIHFGATSPHNAQSHGPSFNFPPGDSVTNFHVYAVEWTTNAISWYVDNHLYQKQTNWWSSSNRETPGKRNPYPAPFDQPFYINMNLAIGGDFGGRPDDATIFPGELQIKYVRAYWDPSASPPLQTAQSKVNVNAVVKSSGVAGDVQLR